MQGCTPFLAEAFGIDRVAPSVGADKGAAAAISQVFEGAVEERQVQVAARYRAGQAFSVGGGDRRGELGPTDIRRIAYDVCEARIRQFGEEEVLRLDPRASTGPGGGVVDPQRLHLGDDANPGFICLARHQFVG